MRATLTFALTLAALPLVADTPTVPTKDTVSVPKQTELMALAANFQGADTAAAIAAEVHKGASLKSTDIKGNTPLILLAAAIEQDPRCKTDDAFRDALYDTVILLMQNGADCLVENNAGCNAVFFLHSSPELMQKLTQLKLIPRELTIRIPHDDTALSRYMQLRIAQAGYSTNPFCLDYLKRRYCKPAYPRVKERLETYLEAETSSLIPTGALQDTLAFLRMADEEAISAYINKLTLWEHGEHFLEEIPERLLVALSELNWAVDFKSLQQALDKLETLLPMEEGDMIDCYAAYPMSKILEIMVHQDAEKAQPQIEKFTSSHDPDVAYAAYRILLQQKKLPLPEPGPLSERLDLSRGIEAMPDDQRRMLECAIVDDAIRQEDMKSVTPEMLQRVIEHFRGMNLENHANILSSILRANRILTPEEGFYEACALYKEEKATTPRIIMAKYILEHPEMFSHVTP